MLYGHKLNINIYPTITYIVTLTMVLLLHITTWSSSWLSTDHEDGQESMPLPLVDAVLLQSSGIGKPDLKPNGENNHGN